MPATSQMPKYRELMLPVLRTIADLGGSGQNSEIRDRTVESGDYTDKLIAETYPDRDRGILVDRIDWAISYCKLARVVERPRRGLYVLSDLGRQILLLPEEDAVGKLIDLDRAVRAGRPKKASDKGQGVAQDDIEADVPGDHEPSLDEDQWKDLLLKRLHQLSPEAFERFSLYLLRSYGMKLERVGGTGDEGIDGIGSAPITPILSRTVAVQAKRYEPSRTVGRETVALFQADALAVGAEHGVLITTARFSAPAKKAALGRTPTIDLIDGDRLADLVLEEGLGVQLQPVVQDNWFDQFES